MITAASAQPAEPAATFPGRVSTSGITWGTLPFSYWSAATSFSHFVKKRRHVEVEGGGAGEDLGVARPAQPLVALRAVGGDVEEVALLSPDGCCAGAG